MQGCRNAMKFFKPTIVNRFGFHTLQRIITHLAIITHKTAIKMEQCGEEEWKRADVSL